MAYVYNPLLPAGLDKVGAGASTSPGGSDTQVQFNDAGSFGGSADLTWDDTGKVLGVGGDVDLDDGGTYTTTLQTITATANRTISFPDATGTVALVAGSSGQLIYNSAGANAGVPGSVVGGTGDVALSLAGAASTPPLSLTGTWFTGGTATTTKPQLLIEPSGTTSTAWSTSGTGLGVNAASGFAGNLLDLQVGGTSRVWATAAGGVVGNQSDSTYNNAQYGVGGVRTTGWGGNSSELTAVVSSTWRVAVSPWQLKLNDGVALNFGVSADASLNRDAADILAQRRGTNAQTLRVYGTCTDLSNHVRGSLSATSTAVTLAAETAGTGADDIPLNLTAAGTGTVKVNSVAEVAVSSTVAGLPATPAVGMLTRVTDADTPAVGSTVTGGGAAAALVWWNGSNWTVIGV